MSLALVIRQQAPTRVGNGGGGPFGKSYIYVRLFSQNTLTDNNDIDGRRQPSRL